MAPRNTISRLTSRIDELTERLTPERGLITIIGGNEAGCRTSWKRSRRLANARDATSASSLLALNVRMTGPHRSLTTHNEPTAKCLAGRGVAPAPCRPIGVYE
jgi:hypothetical protein